MFGKLSNPSPRLTAIGVVLCLLAAMFAIEAKVAWYSPSGSPSSHISASKLQPADAPKQVAQAIAAPALPQIFFSEVSLFEFAASLLLAPVAILGILVRPPASIPASPGFSSSLFRRPPPQF